MKKSSGEKIFQVINVFLMLIVISTILFPLMHIFSVSVSDSVAVTTLRVGLLPKGFDTGAYKKVLSDAVFIRSLVNTALIMVITTFLSIIIITMMAYALSKEYFFGKRFITYYFVITMYFSGGLIPSYLLVSKYLGLNNNYLAYILPVLVNVFYVIVVKSQLEAVPNDLIDAAYIDGAGEYKVLFAVIFPVIIPTIAAVSMFIALGCWNLWFPTLLYMSQKDMWTLQYYLRAVVFEKFLAYTTDSKSQGFNADIIPPQNYQMASIILVALPIVAIYPFTQKYFVKGMLAGSVKG